MTDKVKWWIALAVLLPGLLRAQVSETILPPTGLTNYSGYVIDADATTNAPAFNRESLLFNIVVRTANSGATVSRSNYYSFRLLDANNTSVPIYDINGNVNASFTYNLSNSFLINGGSSVTRTNLASIRPAARLSPYIFYTVEMRILTNGVNTGRATNDGPRAYYHFTNLVSGDASFNALLTLDTVATNRAYAVQSVAGKDSFLYKVDFTLRRYDDFASTLNLADAIPVSLNYRLLNASNVPVALVNNSTNFTRSVLDYTSGTSNPPAPRVLPTSQTVVVRPAAGEQLDSVNGAYRLVTWISHTEKTNAPALTLMGNTNASTSDRLLHFNGHLLFGGIDTTFSSLNNDPGPSSVVTNSHVNAQLGVDSNSGVVLGKPTHTYGDGTLLNVRLRSNGHAELSSGSVALTAPSPDLDATNRVRFLRTGAVVLGPAGGSSSLRVILPSGFGYRLGDTHQPLSLGTIDFPGVPLGPSLGPTNDLNYAPGSLLYASEESKPLWIQTAAIRWMVASGRFVMTPVGAKVHYVRGDELNALTLAPPLIHPDAAIKRSNERYFHFINGVTSATVEVAADANGNAAMKGDFSFGPGAFPAHFPYDTQLSWTGGGTMKVADDLVAPSSGLGGVAPVAVTYARDCPGCAASAGADTVTMNPAGAALAFTRDGGLVGAGTVPGTMLSWGFFSDGTLSGFAQNAMPFNAANFHMPGAFLRGDQSQLPQIHCAGVLHFTGVAATNNNVVERTDLPSTANAAGYRRGYADYAGLNFSVGANPVRGLSTLAGVPSPPYLLTARSKYYIRAAGVSGIQEAVPGTFPPGLTLYGYPFTFSNYGLNYLDSQNRDSRTDGSVAVPYPSDFVQNFQELKFNCVGGLSSAKVPANDADKVLSYWLGDFCTLAISFQRNAGDECNPAAGRLVLGVAAYPYHLNHPLYGQLGFQANGNLIPRSFGLTGIDSRLKAPNSLKVKGPSGEEYTFNPVVDAYFNSYASTTPGPGWINVAGTFDVPFFEDIKVHLQTSADREGTNALIYLMGGWPKSGGSNNHGWTNASGQNFFTAAYFDDDNLGLPTGVAAADYRNFSTADYHPRAQKTWLDVVNFDYPLNWSPTTKSFTSFAPVTNNLLVLTAEHSVKYLSANNAELVFGVQYEGLPQIDLTSLAFNAIDEATGVASAVATAAGEEVLGVVNEGVEHIGQMLDARMDKFFEKLFDKTFDPVICDLYTTLSNQYTTLAAQPCDFKTLIGSNLDWYITGTYGNATNFSNYLCTKLMGPVGDATSVIYQLDGYLADVEHAIDAITSTITNDVDGNAIAAKLGLFAADVSGTRSIARQLVGSLVNELAAEFINSVVEPQLSSLLAKAEPTLAEIVSVLNNIRAQVSAIRALLQNGAEWANELKAKVNSLSSEIASLTLQVRNDVSNYFAQIDCSIDHPFTNYTAAEIKGLIRQKFEEAFFASQVSVQIQEIIKQRLYDVDAAMKEAIDSAFAQLNGVIKDLISQTLQQLDTQINGFADDLNSVVGAAQINGYAHVTGDSLTLLRLDGHFELKAPDSMELNAYLQIKELNSDGTPGCTLNVARATEVTLGATDVELGWISPDLRANVETKFSFATGPFKLVGMAGSFEVLGGLKFETFEITELSAAVAFGAVENYLSAQTRIKFNAYELAGGIYFGKTCTLDPIAMWAPDVAGVLGNPPFTGAYAYGEGWIPISEALGIPATCLFNISAGVGAGAGYFVEGPTYIGTMLAGVSGEVLCLVTVKGEVKLIGVKQAGDFKFTGTGTISGKAGACPFCVKFNKSIGLRYEQNSWHVD